MIDAMVPDAHQYKLDRGKVKPKDMGQNPDLSVDKGGPADQTLPPDQGVLIAHQAPVKLTFEGNVSGATGKSGGLVGNKDWEWKPTISFAKDANCTSAVITPPTKGNSGTGMWGTKINGCHSAQKPKNDATNVSGTCTNKNLKDDMVLRFRVTIPSSWNNTDLTFYQWTDLNYPYDWNEVRVDDGSGSGAVHVTKGTSTVVKSEYCLKSASKPTAWVKQEFWLDKYKGKTVTISFHLMASDKTNRAGWYIDDVEVKKPF